MNLFYIFIAVIALITIGALIAVTLQKKYFKRNMYIILTIDIFIIIGIIFLYNNNTENTIEHFNTGGLIRCIGPLHNYLVTNEDYILRDGWLIKDERVLSLDRCSRIE